VVDGRESWRKNHSFSARLLAAPPFIRDQGIRRSIIAAFGGKYRRAMVRKRRRALFPEIEEALRLYAAQCGPDGCAVGFRVIGGLFPQQANRLVAVESHERASPGSGLIENSSHAEMQHVQKKHW